MRMSEPSRSSGLKNGSPWMWSQWRCVSRHVAENGSVGRALLAEVAQAGAEVEDDRLVARDVEPTPGRVAAVADDLRAVARRRTTDAVERDADAVGRGVW